MEAFAAVEAGFEHRSQSGCRPKRSLIEELTRKNTPRYLDIVTEWQEKMEKQKVTKEMAKQWRSELLDGLKG